MSLTVTWQGAAERWCLDPSIRRLWIRRPLASEIAWICPQRQEAPAWIRPGADSRGAKWRWSSIRLPGTSWRHPLAFRREPKSCHCQESRGPSPSAWGRLGWHGWQPARCSCTKRRQDFLSSPIFEWKWRGLIYFTLSTWLWRSWEGKPVVRISNVHCVPSTSQKRTATSNKGPSTNVVQIWNRNVFFMQHRYVEAFWYFRPKRPL